MRVSAKGMRVIKIALIQFWLELRARGEILSIEEINHGDVFVRKSSWFLLLYCTSILSTHKRLSLRKPK